MSILIGLRCADGAVLASDTQETRSTFFRFWPKMGPLGDRFVLATAGNITMGEVLARRMRRALEGVGSPDSRSPDHLLEVLDGVLAGLRQELGEEGMKGREALLAGVVGQGQVCLWVVDSGEAFWREWRSWEACGSAIDMADFLLRLVYRPDQRVEEGVRLAGYVVERVAEVAPDCGGPVQIATVRPEGVRLLSPEEVEAALAPVRRAGDLLHRRLFQAFLAGRLDLERLQNLLKEVDDAGR